MASFNEQFHDLIIVRQLLLNRVGNHLADKTEKAYLQVIKDIVSKIKQHEHINPAKLKSILKDISKIINPNLDFMSKDLTELANKEALFIQNKANAIADYAIFATVPPKSVINAIYNTSLMAGGDRAYTIIDWYNGIDKSLLNKVDGSIKIGMMQGETGYEIAKRIQQHGIKTVRDAKAIALTSVSHIAHNAREAVYDANSEVIKGWKSHATLDNRTSFICANYDGAMYDFKTHKGINDKGKQFKYFPPPRHPNCRSVHIIITKSYKELGLDIEEISTKTRSSMDGAVPSDMTFNDWIKTKSDKQIKRYLGKGRYELYKDKKITLSDLVNQKGRVLRFDELDSK